MKSSSFVKPIRGHLVIVALLAGLISLKPAHAEFQTPTAITNVTIVVEPGVTIESGTIVMANGRIVDAGADVMIPPHAEQIDGSGMIAYAGLIDAQTHLGVPEATRDAKARERVEDENPDHRQGPLSATRLANRRGVRPEFRALDLCTPDDKQLVAHRAAGFTTALIAPRDGVFSGTSHVMNLSGAPLRRAVLVPDAAMHGSFSTGEAGAYPQTLLGVIAQFRQVLLDAMWHEEMTRYAERNPTNAERVATDAALDALKPLLTQSRRLIFEANSENEINRALDLAAEFNLDVAISGAKEAWKVAPRLAAEGVPLIVTLKFDDEPEYGKKKTGKDRSRSKPEKEDIDESEPDSAEEEEEEEEEEKSEEKKEKEKKEEKIFEPLRARKEKRRLWEEQVANLIQLHKDGIPFGIRTRDFKKTAELWSNLHKVIERGLPEEAVIAALTTSPAALIGMEGQLGAIRPGFIANLTLMDKSITDKKAKPKMLFIDGKKFDLEDDKIGRAEAGGTTPGFDLAHIHTHGGCCDIQLPDEYETQSASSQLTDPPEQPETRTAEPEPTEKPGDIKKEEDEEEDKGPTFAVEIEEDRIPKRQTGGNVVIQNATIIPVSSPMHSNASIMIRNGIIEAIGEIRKVPDGFTVIDGTGLFVIPGFVDCHSHLGIDGVNEAPLAISAEVRIADLINPRHVGIYRAAAGGTTTHHVMHGSANPIGGQNAIVKTKYGRSAQDMLMDAPPTIKFALGENVTRVNSRQGWGQRFPGTRMGVEAVIRTALESAKAYQTEWDAYLSARRYGEDLPPPRRDLRLEALAAVLSGAMTVHAHCYRSDEILRLLHTAEEYGFRIGTLHHVLEGYRIAPEIARHGAGASPFSNHWSFKIEAYGAIPHNAALMTEQGVNVSINSDSPVTIRHLALEAAKCIKWGGLDEDQALRLVTLNAAQQLQIDDRVGSLEVGKDGDLAIFNGHPLNTFARNVLTIIDGEIYFEDYDLETTEPADALNLTDDVDRTLPHSSERTFAIVGATVHPISGPPVENGTVVIVDGRIHAVGVDAAIPPGADVIDANGLHVYPGLIDAASRLGLAEIGSTRATNDFADIADHGPHLRAASGVHPHSAHIRIARTAGTTTTLAVPAGGVISGRSDIIRLKGWTVDEMLVAENFGLHVSLPIEPEPRIGRWRLTEQQLKQRKEQVKRQRKELETFVARAKHYAHVKELADNDPSVTFRIDLKLEAMIPYVRGEKPVVFSASTYREIVEALEFAEKHGLTVVLQGATQAWKLADTLAEKDIPVILGSPSNYPRGEFEPWDSVYRCAYQLDRAGVRFCFASHSASNAFDLGHDAGMAVAFGLPKERAEYALTLGAAEILGIDDHLGSIEPGKVADLIVTTDTPLQTVSQVTHMFLAGEPVELTSMHTEYYEKFRNRPAPALPPARTDLRGPKSLTTK